MKVSKGVYKGKTVDTRQDIVIIGTVPSFTKSFATGGFPNLGKSRRQVEGYMVLYDGQS